MSRIDGYPALDEAKNGDIGGALLEDDVLDSSRSMLQGNRGDKKNLKGAQQFFTPPAVAKFIAYTIGSDQPALDLTAGNGALLAPFKKDRRFGIEIDADQVKRGEYNALRGDAQKAVPMLRALGIRFPAIALNPPFGLQWNDPVHGGEKNSSTLAFLWAIDLLDQYGHGAILIPTSRMHRELMAQQTAKDSVYAILDIEDSLWPGQVETKCSIAFFTHPRNAGHHKPLKETRRVLTTTTDNLDDHIRELARLRYEACTLATTYTRNPATLYDPWNATVREYDRRRREARGKAKPEYDADVKGDKLHVYPQPYARLKLAQAGILRQLETLNAQSVNYFAQNTRAWKTLVNQEEEGLIKISPALKEKAAKVMEESEVLGTPLFPIKPQMRLGWLTDLTRIKAKKDDEARGFAAGETYPLKTFSRIVEDTEERAHEKKNGEIELRKFSTERKLLAVNITGDLGLQTFNESPENIKYLETHFELPDPGDVATRYPDKVRENRELLEEIERDVAENFAQDQNKQRIMIQQKFRYKNFQKDHLSRLLVKGRGLLAHEQGLGKTLMLMTLAEAVIRKGAKNRALFVAPQDLIPQWQREAQKFFGRQMEYIRTPAQARAVAKHLEAGGEGWYITNFEALSIVGRKAGPKNRLPEVPLDPAKHLKHRLFEYKRAKRLKKINSVRAEQGLTTVDQVLDSDEEWDTDEELLATTRLACPKCYNDTSLSWDGEVCQTRRGGCGYVHRRIHAKSGYSALTKCFIDGVVCVDELSEIRGDDSLRSKCIRALARGKHKFGGTGTPVSNYINDAFWGLWWTLGNASPAFPYDYHGGKAKFEADFCVIEYMMGRKEKHEEHKRERRKVLPRVTNVSQFWRLSQPAVSRCRKEQTGEPLVPRTYHPIVVPQGVRQRAQQNFWIANFVDFFMETSTNEELLDAGRDVIEKLEMMLGLRWKLEFAATMPAEDMDAQAWPTAQEKIPDLSNWTPAALKVLELALEHAGRGEKVLIGSDLIATGYWLSERLTEKGVYSVHITEEKQGKLATKNPRKRAGEIQDFANGDAQVLCTGVNAMKLGHNLDVASTVIVHGLPDSFMVMDQFLARVHRLTSKREVNVYVVIPKDSLAEQKWQRLKDKGGASDLAFDGELSLQNEEAINWQQVLKEMKAKGIKPTGEEVPEEDIEAAFAALPALARPSAPKPLLPEAPKRPRSAPEHRPATKPKSPQPAPAGGLLGRLTGDTKLSWDDVEAKGTTTKEQKKDDLVLSLF